MRTSSRRKNQLEYNLYGIELKGVWILIGGIVLIGISVVFMILWYLNEDIFINVINPFISTVFPFLAVGVVLVAAYIFLVVLVRFARKTKKE